MCVQFERFWVIRPIKQPLPASSHSLEVGEGGEALHLLYTAKQSSPFSCSAPVASNITIYIPEEPDDLPQKLHQNRSETALLSIIF